MPSSPDRWRSRGGTGNSIGIKKRGSPSGVANAASGSDVGVETRGGVTGEKEQAAGFGLAERSAAAEKIELRIEDVGWQNEQDGLVANVAAAKWRGEEKTLDRSIVPAETGDGFVAGVLTQGSCQPRGRERSRRLKKTLRE